MDYLFLTISWPKGDDDMQRKELFEKLFNNLEKENLPGIMEKLLGKDSNVLNNFSSFLEKCFYNFQPKLVNMEDLTSLISF